MRETFRKLFDLLDARERRRFFLLLVAILGMGIMEAAGVASILPFLAVLSRPEMVQENATLARLYELGGFASTDDFLMALGMGVFGIVILNLIVKSTATYAMTRFAQMRSFTLSTRLLSGYLGQPYVWFLNRHTADLSKTMLGEVEQVTNGVMLPMVKVIAYSVVVLFLVGLVVAVNPMAALVGAAGLGICYTLIYTAARNFLSRIGRDRVKANRERFQITQEALGGIKDVKVLELEQVYARRFQKPARRLARYRTQIAVIGELPRHLLEALLFGGMLLLLLHMMLTREGGLAEVIPVIGLYAFAGARLFPAMQQLYSNLAQLRFSRAALDSLHADLVETGAMTRHLPDDRPEPMGLREKLELRGIEYAYPTAERAAVRGLDLDIGARTTVGLVGGTGAGKTTAVDVILGLLAPQKGALVVDGREVSGDDLRAWRRSIGYVPQHIFLADDSVAGNIAFGIPDDEIDMEAVTRAAKVAELHDFVMSDLPQGYATRVGERGVRLSGGQRQRIGIARALYHDPDVLVLDEATSALDNLTERAVMDAVHNLGHAKTIVMIAHRLSTVRECDEIFLMERGRVAARGAYDELLEGSETFRAMARGAA